MIPGSEPGHSYKWGKFQGVVSLLLGCFLLFAGGLVAREEGATKTVALWMSGMLLSATGIGLVGRRCFGAVLVYALCALTLLEPLRGQRPEHREGYLFHALSLGFWGFPAVFYYPKRWKELR